jgi:uncharacterized phiE125 gp8 family phage protein
MALDTVNALVSLADAKAFLKISAASEDTVIENMINRASAFANDYTQRLLLSRVNTDYYDGDGTGTLILNQYPVTALSNLYDDVDRAFGAGTAINVSTDVVLDNNNGLIRLFNQAVAFNVGILNVKAVYTAGYSLANVPASIQEAVLLYVANAYRSQYLGQRFGATSEHVGDRSTTYSNDEIMNQVKGLLNPHRSERAFIHAV